MIDWQWVQQSKFTIFQTVVTRESWKTKKAQGIQPEPLKLQQKLVSFKTRY